MGRKRVPGTAERYAERSRLWLLRRAAERELRQIKREVDATRDMPLRIVRLLERLGD